eukprot:tig00001264_g7859.t1
MAAWAAAAGREATAGEPEKPGFKAAFPGQNRAPNKLKETLLGQPPASGDISDDNGAGGADVKDYDVHPEDAKDTSTLGRIDRLLHARGRRTRKREWWRVGLPIFNPANRLKSTWDIIMMFLLLYNVAVVPFRIAYDVPAEDAWAAFEIYVDAMFIADCLAMFRTAFFDEVGSLVADPRAIARRYLRTWFLLDFLSALPIDTILKAIVDNNPAFRLPRLLRLVRLFRFFAFIRRISENGLMRKVDEKLQVNPAILRLFKFVFWLALIAHWFACIQFFTVRAEDFPPESWVVRLGLHEAPTSAQYVSTIYWVTTTLTTVGYGDIAPGTDAERVVTVFMQLAGATVFAWIVGNMTQVIGSLDVGAARKQKKLEAVKAFMRHRRLPGEMQKRVEKYFQFTLNAQSLQEESEIMQELTPALRQEIRLHLHRDIIEKVPFFRGRDTRFIARIVALLRPAVAAPNDSICEARPAPPRGTGSAACAGPDG